jgi:peptidoglycan/xylan/chitin deacetylase (PgdA/CDA1 family)
VLKRLTTLIAICIFYGTVSAQTLDNATILARKQVPILCYHQIRNWRASDKQLDKDYIIPPATFKTHMKMLADSGYHTILPDELYEYLTKGTPLPEKPIMLTFDDTDGDQYEVARPELTKYGFKGVYFIIFNNINKNHHYMTRQQIRQLSEEGSVIACHTLTHPNFKKLKGAEWDKELEVPKKKLEILTGKPVNYFAFPYGAWNASGLPELHKRGFLAAFQLSEKRDSDDPIMTIRRVLGCGYWSAATLDYNIKHDFGRPVSKNPAQDVAQQPGKPSPNQAKKATDSNTNAH